MTENKTGATPEPQRPTPINPASAEVGKGIDFATGVMNDVLNDLGPPPGSKHSNVVVFKSRKRT